MGYYDRLKRKRLSDILVDEEMSSKGAVITAVHESHQSGRLLSTILISGSELTEYDMARVLVKHYQLPFIELAHYSYHRDLIDKFPPDFLQTKRLVPLDQFGESVCFATQEFPDDETMAKLEAVVEGPIFFFAAMSADIVGALHDNLTGRVEEPKLAALAVGNEQSSEPAPDQDWAKLFDNANESIVSTLTATPISDDDDEDDDDGAEDNPLGILGTLGDD